MRKQASISLPSAFVYEQRGQGPVVLFLHGLFGDPSNWMPTMDALEETYTVIALHYPFFDDKNLCNVQGLTEYTIAFIDELGLESMHLCGNSIGGQIALDLALKQPERIGKMILTGSAGLWEAQADGTLPRATREFIREQADKIFYDASRHVDEEMIEKLYGLLQSRNFTRTLLRLARDTQRYTLDEHLHRIKSPTLLVWGAEDQITPPDVAQMFHEKIPGSELVFVQQCGHAPPLESPQRFLEEVQRFLNAP
jgi:pimeloyl-ACP methyl ester carboxylesterase